MPQCPLCSANHTRHVWLSKGYDLFHCRLCDVIFVYPQPDQELVRQMYFGSYHAWMIRWYNNPLDLTPENSRDLKILRAKADLCLKIIHQLHPQPGSILDFGCTVGLFLEQAQKAGWKVEGVEINPATARVAAQRLSCNIHTDPLEEIDLHGRMFDVITAWDVLEHLPKPGRLLDQASRALKPGGFLGLSTPNYAGLFPKLSLVAAPLTGYWPHPEPPAHLFQFSLSSIEYLLNEHGFELVCLKHAGIDWQYTFGSPRELLSSYKRFLFCLAFIPSSLLGPALNKGDLLYVVARKHSEA